MRGLSWVCISGFSLACVAASGLAGCGDDDARVEPDAHVTMDATVDGAIDGALADASSDDDAGFDPRAVECFADLMAPSESFVSIQRFVSEDGTIKLWRARQPGNRSGAFGETFAYDLVRAWVDSPREPNTCVTDATALSYEFEHHNWNDTWTVVAGDTRFEVNELYSFDGTEPTWSDTLRMFEPNDVPVGGTQTLVAAGCSSLPYDLNPCMLRVRVDMPPAGWGE